MKRKTRISLMLALLMVVSTFTVVGSLGTVNTNTENCPKGDIDFTKTVWNVSIWDESINAEIGDTVRFNITLTYYKHPDNPYDWNLHDIKIKDELPDCLEFANDVTVQTSGPSQIEYTEEVVGVWIYWNFTYDKPMLADGENLYIEFNATVVESEELENQNWAYVHADEDEAYEHDAEDDAWVYVVTSEITFEKKVWDSDEGEWVEETSVFVGDTVRFKIELTYYGNYNLSDIRIVDQLPYCLEYADNANITQSNVSGNLKTIWWNLTEDYDINLTDGQSASIEFDANATETTGCESGINTATVTAYEQQNLFEASDTASVIVFDLPDNVPPCPPIIAGPKSGEVDEELTFQVVTGDYNGDNIFYWIDWGDGSNTGWVGPFPSDVEQEFTHAWSSEGDYEVKAKAKDDNESDESNWGNILTVNITPAKKPALDVTIKRGLGRSVSVNIKNTGEIDVNDIAWNLTVSRRGIFKRTLWEDNDSIPSLGTGVTETIGGSPFGIGLITVTVNVSAPGIDPIIVKPAKGFIFLRFVWVRYL